MRYRHIRGRRNEWIVVHRRKTSSSSLTGLAIVVAIITAIYVIVLIVKAVIVFVEWLWAAFVAAVPFLIVVLVVAVLLFAYLKFKRS